MRYHFNQQERFLNALTKGCFLLECSGILYHKQPELKSILPVKKILLSRGGLTDQPALQPPMTLTHTKYRAQSRLWFAWLNRFSRPEQKGVTPFSGAYCWNLHSDLYPACGIKQISGNKLHLKSRLVGTSVAYMLSRPS